MSANFYKKLGAKIKVIRDKIDLSQEELADKLGIPRVSLSQIENGDRKISAEEIAKLSRIFNTRTDTLLNLEKGVEVVLDEKQPKKQKNSIRINVPQKNMDKFREILLYIINKVGSKPNIGEAVIYKLLYFIDFDFYEKYEEQLIGATYIKNHYGPTPNEFIKIVEKMEKDEDLVKIQSEYFKYPQTKYLPLRKANLSKIEDARAIELIDDVLKIHSDKNAAEISDYSHGDVPWLTTEDGGIIDYESVFYRTSPYSVRSYSEEDI
jgi:transcriptional regulator with XRE-family HTH domain